MIPLAESSGQSWRLNVVCLLARLQYIQTPCLILQLQPSLELRPGGLLSVERPVNASNGPESSWGRTGEGF